MADNSLDILIKLGVIGEKDAKAVNQLLSETKTSANQAALSARELGDSADALARHYSDGLNPALAEHQKNLKENGEEEQKSFASKKQLKDIVKQLNQEFPVLGQVARLALNPIALGAAAAFGAFAILRVKLQETVEAFGNAKWGTDKINAAAEAWHNYSEALGRVKVNTDGLSANLQSIAAYMALINRLGKTTGQDTENNPLFARKEAEAQVGQMRRTADEARKKAAALRNEASAADPKSSEQRDKNTQKKLDEDAAKVIPKIAQLDAEIAKLEEAYSPENKGNPKYIAEHLQFAARYGVMTDPEAIVTQLKAQRAGYQGSIDLADQNRTRNETNAARRSGADSMRSKADELDAGAAQIEAEAKRTSFNAQVRFYEQSRAQGITPNVTPTGRGVGVTAEAKAYFDNANRDLVAIGKAWASAVEALRTQAENQARHTANLRHP